MNLLQQIDQAYLVKLVSILLTIALLAAGFILAKLYYNIGKENEEFDKKRFLNGIYKLLIVIIIVSILTVCWLIYLKFNLITEEMIDPFIVCYFASIYYFVKLSDTLIDIFEIKEYLIDKLVR